MKLQLRGMSHSAMWNLSRAAFKFLEPEQKFIWIQAENWASLPAYQTCGNVSENALRAS